MMESFNCRNPWVRKTCLGFAIISIVLVLLELAIRGIMPLVDSGYKCFELKSVTPSEFVGPDKALGYTLNDGTFHFENACGLRFSATHRLGKRVVTTPKNDTLPEVWILGDSYGYGYGVDDTCTYAYYLQQVMPQYSIVNLSGPGYSAVANFLQLEALLTTKGKVNKPTVVIFQCSEYDKGRIILSPRMLDAYRSEMQEVVKLPYVFNSSAGLTIDYKKLPDRNSLITNSLLASTVHKIVLVKMSEGVEQNSDSVVVALYHRVAQLCKEHEVSLLMLSLHSSRGFETRIQETVLGNFLNPRIDTLSVDHTLLPLDNHLSPKGHAYLARALRNSLSL